MTNALTLFLSETKYTTREKTQMQQMQKEGRRVAFMSINV